MKKFTKKNACAFLIACAASAGAFAQSAMPPEQTQGNVRYVTGGIGKDESEAMKAAESTYSISLVFAVQRDGKADYLANVPVTIRDTSGNTVFSLSNDGPYLLVKLPAGSYDVSASHDGQVKSQHVTVGPAGRADHRLTFDWS
jgi:opacity protein-like surface antigen